MTAVVMVMTVRAVGFVRMPRGFLLRDVSGRLVNRPFRQQPRHNQQEHQVESDPAHQQRMPHDGDGKRGNAAGHAVHKPPAPMDMTGRCRAGQAGDESRAKDRMGSAAH